MDDAAILSDCEQQRINANNVERRSSAGICQKNVIRFWANGIGAIQKQFFFLFSSSASSRQTGQKSTLLVLFLTACMQAGSPAATRRMEMSFFVDEMDGSGKI